MPHRLTRGQFFQIVTVLLDYQDVQNPIAHCTIYNDGCNDCYLSGDILTCTERACIWQGIPSCSQCEAGYALQDGRCIANSVSCKNLGETVSNLSLPPEYQFS
jgi:hypothetical protein